MFTKAKEKLLLEMLNKLADTNDQLRQRIQRLETQVGAIQAAERRRNEERVRGVSR